MVKVYCINKNPFMDSIKDQINEQEDMIVVGYDSYTVALGKEIDAAMVIIDIDSFPNDKAPAVIKGMKKSNRKIIAVINMPWKQRKIELIESGVDSIIIKTEKNIARIAEILRAINADHFVLPAESTQHFISELLEAATINQEIFAHYLEKNDYQLTHRESDTAYLMRLGMRNKEIARLLDIAEGTVKVHISSIYKKLGIKGRKKVISRLNDMIL
ncbi:hypothetical protein CIL03_11355 [Virgibacillus indicus]|uniref:HTH luxR-type domain-containing protein n=1 Tax=Virgibacillus indicus TaxID=2024554 RepID=A0A265N9U4_9BACI|nr:LuxR C-terminal-related transcriptional regulator [Virgibacillus indicus]OZU88244.1 hypothetical protein CIL03_11355 [Virgibacillus indicus]